MRLLALLLLLAVLPTAELAEQASHVVSHLLGDDAADHVGHHDASQGDEHGCTGLVHLCSCHQTQITASYVNVVIRNIEQAESLTIRVPDSLVDLTSPEPAQRPPIG
jgi:hypothetical protein